MRPTGARLTASVPSTSKTASAAAPAITALPPRHLGLGPALMTRSAQRRAPTRYHASASASQFDDSATAQLLKDALVRDGLPNLSEASARRRRMLGHHGRRVNQEFLRCCGRLAYCSFAYPLQDGDVGDDRARQNVFAYLITEVFLGGIAAQCSQQTRRASGCSENLLFCPLRCKILALTQPNPC